MLRQLWRKWTTRKYRAIDLSLNRQVRNVLEVAIVQGAEAVTKKASIKEEGTPNKNVALPLQVLRPPHPTVQDHHPQAHPPQWATSRAKTKRKKKLKRNRRRSDRLKQYSPFDSMKGTPFFFAMELRTPYSSTIKS